jgi:hypothetical protein
VLAVNRGRFFAKSLYFRGWNVAGEGSFEIIEGVAFGAMFPDPDGFRPNPIRTELLSKPEFVELFVFESFLPWPLPLIRQLVNQFVAENLFDLLLEENNEDIEE